MKKWLGKLRNPHGQKDDRGRLINRAQMRLRAWSSPQCTNEQDDTLDTIKAQHDFLAQHGPLILRTIKQLAPEDAPAQLLSQIMDWLFDGKAPKILDYTGDQPLDRWLKAAIARYVIHHRKTPKP